jgi:hypothetical protein
MTKQRAKKLKVGEQVWVKRGHSGWDNTWTVVQVFPEYQLAPGCPCVLVQLQDRGGKVCEYQHTLLEIP